MAEQTLEEVKLRDDFYQDSFGKVIAIMLSIIIAIILLLGIALYLYKHKPTPVTFLVGTDWHVQTAVPLNQPYLSNADVLQWVGMNLPQALTYDFTHYQQQLQVAAPHFTANGWHVFLNQLNIYANYDTLVANKLFVNGIPAGAPVLVNQGLLDERYAWWVQMPITMTYTGYNPGANKTLTLQVLIVRVSTMSNLDGIGIDNVIVAKSSVSQPIGSMGNGIMNSL